jgi:capsid protein
MPPPNIASPGFAYPASRVTSATLDWPILGTDPNDDWWRESTAIGNRSWHLWRNNAYARAMGVTMLEGTLGANGLVPRSVYTTEANRDAIGDDAPDADALQAMRSTRVAIDRSLRKSYRGTRFDAAGQLSKREMSMVMLVSMMVAGDGFAIRQWKPNRPDAYQATCWRIIDPSRVSNPNFSFNTATLFEGIALDEDGAPIGIWVQRRNPYAVQVVDWSWDYIPWYAPDGTLNVVHLKAPGRPDEIRGIGWFAPIMGLINQMGGVTDSYVAAKRMQACIGLVITGGDPASNQAADQQGARTQQARRFYPGMTLYEPSGVTVTPLNWNFQGQDHGLFQDAMLQAICAAWGLPMEVVQHRMSKSALSSARAALMQYCRTVSSAQEIMIDHVERPWAESVVREEIARRRLPVEDIEDACEFRFNRPPQAFPDPVREATADQMRIEQGESFSSVFSNRGKDYEHEVLQQHQDRAFASAHGVQLGPAGKSGGAPSAGQGTMDTAGKPGSVDGTPVAGADDAEDAEDAEDDASEQEQGTPQEAEASA